MSEQSGEGLLDLDQAHVMQDLRDEAGVKQVEDCVLDAAHVLIDRHPIGDLGRIEDLLSVV